MKLLRFFTVTAALLVAQVVLRQYSSEHQIGIRLADIDRELLRNPPERDQLLLEKARLLENTGHFENALRAYTATSSATPQQIAAVKLKIEQQQQQLALARGQPRVFALLIGISDYEVASLPRTPTSEADAAAFAGFLRGNRRAGAIPKMFTLIGRNAREAAVRTAFQTVLGAQARPEDTVYVYISAHGLTEPAPGHRAFLMAADTNPWEKTAAGYALRSLRELLEKNPSRPRNVLVVGDLCQTRSFDGRSNDVNQVVEQQLGTSNPYLQVILAGCPEPGLGKPPSNLGLFTHHLLQGLERAADRNGDRKITNNELFDYVRDRTAAATRGRSTAVRFGAKFDIPLAQTTSVARRSLPSEVWLRTIGSPFAAYAQEIFPQEPPTMAQQVFAEGDPAFDLAVAAEDLGQQVILRYLLGEDVPQTQIDFDRGAELFQLANQLNPSPHLRGREAFCVGRSLIFQRRFPEAVSRLEQTISVESDAAYAWNALGVAYLEQGQFAEAADRFRRAILYAPSWPYARNNLALTLTELGRYRQAESEYRIAIARAPQSGYLQYNLGALLHRRNRLEDARAVYDQLLAQHPGLAHAHIGRGALWASSGEFGRAIQEYEQALAIDKNSGAARHNLAQAYARRGETGTALKIWLENTQLSPDFTPSRVCLAETYEKQGNWQKAAEEYAAVLERNTNLIAARIALGEALRRQGSLKESENQLRTALKQAPEYWLIHELLGDVLRGLGSSEFREEYRIARQKAYEKSDKTRLKTKLEGGSPPDNRTVSTGKSSCYP